MARPAAWSHSALESYENCPRQHQATKVLKRFPFVDSKEMAWGREVHKHFENFLLHATPLPADLVIHQGFLEGFKAQPGELAGEERIALDTQLRACGYFAKDVQVWYRGQVDGRKRDRARGFSHIGDWKTGKLKTDYTQLKSFAMWEFLTQPDIHTVKAEYYWTQTRGTNGETYVREQLPEILEFFRVKLVRFADAYINDVWPPKQSGLCGWCPVTDCQFWRERRKS